MEVERRDEQTKRSRPTLIVTVKTGLIELKVKTYTLIESENDKIRMYSFDKIKMYK